MQEKTSAKVSGGKGRIGGASIAWVTFYGALCGVASLIPIFPYVGGGGYVPLTTPLCAIAPLLLGPWGGIAASIVGGVIGMFIAPAAYPMGILDIMLTAVIVAILMALMQENRTLWKVTTPVFIILGIAGWLVPFYIPGAAGKFAPVPEPLYFILTAIYWIPSTIIAITPLGTRLIPDWMRSQKRVERYGGIFLALLAAIFVWWLPWTKPYWYILNYSPEMGLATTIGYIWWVPALSAVVTVITIPIVEALERSGLPKVQGSIW